MENENDSQSGETPGAASEDTPETDVEESTADKQPSGVVSDDPAEVEVNEEPSEQEETKTPAVSKDRRSEKNPQNTECQNCSATLKGDYCHQCGQAAKEPRRLVIGLVQDVVVETLAIDGKLARTLALLISRPGRLARRYLDGKRIRYSPPLRLYLFASVFFFFAAFWMVDFSNDPIVIDEDSIEAAQLEDAEAEVAAAREQVQARLREAGVDVPSDLEGEGPEEAEVDEPSGDAVNNDESDAIPEDSASDVKFTDKTWADVDYEGPDWLEPHAEKLFEAAQRVAEDPRLFISEMQKNIPRFLLLAPVIYGLTLMLLYFYRRKIFIYDHFIVSLYMHAALYTYFLAALLISRMPVVGGLWFIPIVWGVFQPMLVLRQTYGSNWLSVVIKWILSMGVYLTAFALIIVLGLSYSLYQS